MTALAIVPCANHQGREAIGVCVRCRRRVCSECTTKIDGINHCVRCWEELAKEHERVATAAHVDSPTKAAVFAGLSFVLASAVAWAILELFLPGGPGGR